MLSSRPFEIRFMTSLILVWRLYIKQKSQPFPQKDDENLVRAVIQYRVHINSQP